MLRMLLEIGCRRTIRGWGAVAVGLEAANTFDCLGFTAVGHRTLEKLILPSIVGAGRDIRVKELVDRGSPAALFLIYKVIQH